MARLSLVVFCTFAAGCSALSTSDAKRLTAAQTPLYWTYLGLFIAIWCGTCCIVTASTWCCLVALCPSELVMSCKLCGGAC